MSIARAFTLRRKRPEPINPPSPTFGRSASMRYSDKPVDIRKISSPVALLSTTNMLSYNAPDVSTLRAQRKASGSVSSGSSSRSSADESDTSRDTTMTDVSSIASTSSPTSSPGANRSTSSSYLGHSKTASLTPPIPQRLSRSTSTIELRHQSQASTSSSFLEVIPGNSPEIPQRSPRHSKKAHEILARKRSLQTMSRHGSISSIASSSREKRSSFEFFSKNIADPAPPSLPTFAFASPQEVKSTTPPPSTHHPFGKELMQLDEIAEEFGGAVRDVEREGDLRAMRQKGLVKFCAEDYLKEIQPLFGGAFSPYAQHRMQQQEVAWI